MGLSALVEVYYQSLEDASHAKAQREILFSPRAFVLLSRP